jgi:hypothetical protein
LKVVFKFSFTRHSRTFKNGMCRKKHRLKVSPPNLQKMHKGV